MKRFKIIFHIVYLILVALVLVFSIIYLKDPANHTTTLIKTFGFKNTPILFGISFLILSIFMFVEFGLEQFAIFGRSKEIKDLESQIVTLKAKLYDKSEAKVEEIKTEEITPEESLETVETEEKEGEAEEPSTEINSDDDQDDPVK